MSSYDMLSKYYETLTDAKNGAYFFKQLIHQYANGSRVLDCACGNGALVELLDEDGMKAQGFDISQQMLQQTQKKHLFQVQDMRSFCYSTQFDTIVCFCDSINYLLTENDVTQFLKLVYQHLSHQGVFIFDMLKEELLKEFEEEYYETGVLGNDTYQWMTLTQNDLLQHTFIVNHQQEQHVQRIYTLSKIEKILQEIGFQIEVVPYFDEYQNEKHIIVCRKE